MPEYLAPGVYLEEVSYRTRSIEGVSTTTAAFVGPTRSGPLDGALDIITNVNEYELTYGDGQKLDFGVDGVVDNWMWHAVRAFFGEGGQRLYVKRVYRPAAGDGRATAAIHKDALARLDLKARHPGVAGNLRVSFTAQAGQNALAGTAAGRIVRGLADHDLVLVSTDGSPARTQPATAMSYSAADGTRGWRFAPAGTAAAIELASLVSEGASVRPVTVTVTATSTAPGSTAQVWSGLPLDQAHALGGAPDALTAVFGAAGGTPLVIAVPPGAGGLDVLRALDAASIVPLGPAATAGTLTLAAGTAVGAMKLTALAKGTWSDSLKVEVSGTAAGKRTVTFSKGADKLFDREFTAAADLVAAFDATGLVTAQAGTGNGNWPLTATTAAAAFSGGADDSRTKLIDGLIANGSAEQRSVTVVLQGGRDGERPTAADYEGAQLADDAKTGLVAFEDLDDVSVVAAPGCTYGYASRKADVEACVNALVAHAKRMRYRIAVVDSGNGQTIAEARAMRAKFDSSYAAFYYPWITFVDPVSGLANAMPPSGAVAGIYARNDVTRAVYKAPANEVVNVAIGFERVLSRSQQEVLNPEGINCFRSFSGRGHRLWGARLMSSDPEWRYVNMRRYFAFLERSIERGTQWAVFEPNGERLWASVRGTIEDFLLDQWQTGGLLGDKPEKAYFVRCDRSTMTQNDLDNGRIVCQIGVAPLRPAEFVIFRIGQWTADRKL